MPHSTRGSGRRRTGRRHLVEPGLARPRESRQNPRRSIISGV